MAQSLVSKRRNIATRSVAAATQLWDAFETLQDIALERAQAGNFLQTDFDGTDLEHLTPFMIGVLLDTIVADLNTWMVAGSPVRRDVFLQVRR